MSPKQYKHLLVELELTQRGIARLMDVSERKANEWARDGVQGGPQGLLLALLARGKVTPQDLWDLRLEYERLTAETQASCAKQEPSGL